MVAPLFVEGGGDSKALRTKCREGFRKLIERAGGKGRMPRIVACGGRAQALRKFEIELRTKGSSPTLLVDSEASVESDDPWEHVRHRMGDEWKRPGRATPDQLHLMVQFMETWLLVDRNALEEFFGPGFRQDALPRDPQVEKISKEDVESGLHKATADSHKGSYHKGKHSFELLGQVDPERLAAASPWAQRFFDHIVRAVRRTSP